MHTLDELACRDFGRELNQGIEVVAENQPLILVVMISTFSLESTLIFMLLIAFQFLMAAHFG